MSDDRLRLVASVEDQFTGPLARLKHGIGEVSDTTRKQTGLWRKDWGAVTAEIGRFRGALGNMAPAFSAIGIGSLAAATSLGGAVVALRSFSKESQGLSILSKQTDIAIDSLRALKSLGERVGVSGDAMLNAADTFSRAARLFKRGWHEAVQELPAMKLDWLARELKGASSVEDMMQRMLKALPKISNIEARRRVMVMFFGTEDIDKIIQEFGDKTAAQLEEVRKNIGKLSPESEKAARDFENNVSKMEQRWERLKQATAGPLLGAANEFLDDLEKRGPFGQSKNAPASQAPSDLDESLDAQMRGQRPLSKADKDRQNRADAIARDLAQKSGELDYARKRIVREPEVERRLTAEIQRLTDEMRRLREQGASLSPSSFDGPLGGGSLIQKAAWGGVGFGGGPLGGNRSGGFGGGGSAPRGFGGPPDLPNPESPAIARRFQAPPQGAINRQRSGPLEGKDGPLAAQYPDGLAAGIRQTAKDLGVSAEDIATAISYETGGTFDKWKRGPTTKWGTHRGLIQWGEPQARKYGVTADISAGEQMRAVTRYLRDAGVKPGMGILDIYSAINAGRVGRYSASDAAAGGAPGTVRDKVEHQMHGHRRKAAALLGASPDALEAEGEPAARRQGDAFMQRFFGRGGGAAVARGPMVEGGKGTLHLRFENAPKGLKVDHEMGGLFRAVTESRHRPSEMNEL